METKISGKRQIDLLALKNILSCLPSHVYWKDVNGVYLGCNDLQAQHLGLHHGYEVIGKNDFELPWDTRSAAMFRENDIEVMKTGEIKTIEEEVIIAGKSAIVLSQKVPLKDIKGNIVGVLGISMDITDLKKKEKDLEKAREEAEIANKLKSEFISNMEHDIRTPCSGIAQMTSILEEQEENGKKRETLGCIAKSSKQLLNLLNSIVEFEHIEKKSIPILSKKFDAKKSIHDIVDLEMPSAKAKKLELIVNCSNNIYEIVIGDDYRFERILINLISNAVKFTEKGYVKVNAELVGKKDEKTVVLKIVIEDTGIGIAKDKQYIIYERFSRIIPANKGTYSGIGLGLKIVKQFIEEMEGEIEVESDIGKGSIFTVLLPFKLPLLSLESIDTTKEKVEKASVKRSKKSIKTLLVEDDELAQMVAKDMLETEFGNKVAVAKTGKEALKLAKDELYDIIFMDIGLPDIDGNKVTEKIRKGKSYKSTSVPIIALTAHSTKDIRSDSEKSGMNDFILKPLNSEKVQKILYKWIYHKENSKIEVTNSNNDNTKTVDKIIDIELTTEILGGKLHTAKEMIKTLVEMLPEHKYNLGKAFCIHDFNALSKEAHKLYGATCYCGVPLLKASLKELEIISLKKCDDRKIQESLNKTCDEIDAVIRVYEEDEELKK